MNPARLIAVGDIHGHLRPLQRVIDYWHLSNQDTLVFLGDLVDHGPNSKQVVEYVIRLRDKFDYKFVKGNHEELMLAALNDKALESWWFRYGGETTLQSYSRRFPNSHMDFLEGMHDYCEIDKFLFVHAGVNHHDSLSNMTAQALRWDFAEPIAYEDYLVVAGHEIQKSGLPHIRTRHFKIDTGIAVGCKLTAVDLYSGSYVQADQQGSLSYGHLALE